MNFFIDVEAIGSAQYSPLNSRQHNDHANTFAFPILSINLTLILFQARYINTPTTQHIPLRRHHQLQPSGRHSCHSRHMHRLFANRRSRPRGIQHDSGLDANQLRYTDRHCRPRNAGSSQRGGGASQRRREQRRRERRQECCVFVRGSVLGCLWLVCVCCWGIGGWSVVMNELRAFLEGFLFCIAEGKGWR